MTRGLRSYGREPGILAGTGSAGFESVVTPPLGSGGDRYYDDNAWLGLALVRHHELTGDPVLLRLAERVFPFVVSGWSTEASWEIPGGIRWKEPASNRSRNTCVNGPAAELAARLHEKTGDSAHLEWALRTYEWTRTSPAGPRLPVRRPDRARRHTNVDHLVLQPGIDDRCRRPPGPTDHGFVVPRPSRGDGDGVPGGPGRPCAHHPGPGVQRRPLSEPPRVGRGPPGPPVPETADRLRLGHVGDAAAAARALRRQWLRAQQCRGHDPDRRPPGRRPAPRLRASSASTCLRTDASG